MKVTAILSNKRIGIAGAGMWRLWVFLAACLAFSSGSVAQERYTNSTLGFSITKPAEWHYITAEQFHENLKGADFADPEFKNTLTKYARVPFIAIARFKEPYDDLNPSVRVNVRELGAAKGVALEKVVATITETLRRQFKEFRIEEGPMVKSIAGHSAGYVRTAYSAEFAGRSFPSLSELWVVARGDLLFVIGASLRQDERTGSRAEVQSIIDTIKID